MPDPFQQLGEIQRQTLLATQPSQEAMDRRLQNLDRQLRVEEAVRRRQQELDDQKTKERVDKELLAAQLLNQELIEWMRGNREDARAKKYIESQESIERRQSERERLNEVSKVMQEASGAGYTLTPEDAALLKLGDPASLSSVRSKIQEHGLANIADPIARAMYESDVRLMSALDAEEKKTSESYDRQIEDAALSAVSSDDDLRKMASGVLAKKPIEIIDEAAQKGNQIAISAQRKISDIRKEKEDKMIKAAGIRAAAADQIAARAASNRNVLLGLPGGSAAMAKLAAGLYAPQGPQIPAEELQRRTQNGSLDLTGMAAGTGQGAAQSNVTAAIQTGGGTEGAFGRALGKAVASGLFGGPSAPAQAAPSTPVAKPIVGPIGLQGAPSLYGTGYAYTPPHPSMLSTAQGRAIASEPRRNIFEYAAVPMDRGSGSISDIASNIPALLANIGATAYGAGTEAIAPLARSLGVYSVPAPAQYAGPVNERLRNLSPDELRQLLQTMTMVR